MVQTRTNNYYVCEIKFSKNPVRAKVIDEVAEKINKLKLKKNASVRPVLIHVNGVESAIEKSDFFAAIIDFGELLT